MTPPAAAASARAWRVRDRRLTLDERPLLMGILNVTPDSFSDGGEHASLETAVARGRAMVAEGADIVDVGGESTRPGADPVPTDVEVRRVVPVLEALAEEVDVPLSIDTRKSEVARAALDAGASIVNDVSALRHDASMVKVVEEAGCGVVLMHMQGTPGTMQDDPTYDDVVAEVKRFLADRARHAEDAGVSPDAIVVDPGIGFGKTLEHNLTLLRDLRELTTLGYPLLVGHSRKSFLGALTGSGVGERLPGTLAAGVLAVAGGATLLRVHDVAAARDATVVADAILRGEPRG